MAVNIFEVRGRQDVPDISKATNPVLDVPIINTNPIETALNSYSTEEGSNIMKAEENFNQLVEIKDKLTGQRFDNDVQAQVFERAKKEVGLSDDSFKVSMDDLRDPFKVRGMRSKLGEIYERSDIKEVLFEQENSKRYLEEVKRIKDMNPKLYKKALAKYNDYRNGKVNGFQLLPQEFTPIDIEKTITDALRLVPQVDTSDIETKHGLTYEKVKKQRSREVIDEIIKRLNSNDIFRNNVEANFTNEDGEFDKNSYDEYVDKLATEYARQHTDIENVKQNKPEKTKDGDRLDRLVKNIESLGADPDSVVKNVAALESLLTDKNKHLERIEETSAEVRVYYTDDNKDGEQYISVPKSDKSIMEADTPVGYEVPIEDGGKMTISDEDIDSFLSANPEIEDLDVFGKSHTAPIKGAKSNVGQKTIVKIEDGKLITNDIVFLRQMGIVPDGTDYDELGELGFEYVKNADGTTVVKKNINVNKQTIDLKPVEIPNKSEIEAKLNSNPIISKYPKNSEEYLYATMFLASPEIQDGYYRDVYLKETYSTYLDKLKEVVPLQENGYYDISGVHRSLKPLLSSNAEEKLEYLAHHHGNASNGFLLTGKSKISGNKNADQELISKWKDIDKEIEKNPNISFFDLLKKLESGNKYDAVYSGSADSSALGKYQILFKTHYPKIKKYIDENREKVVMGVEEMSFKSESSSEKVIEAVSKVDKKAGSNPLVFANKYLGINESDPIHQETIKGFLNTAVPGFIDDKSEVTKRTSAWCGAFVNSVLRESGLVSLENGKLSAKNYLNIGDEVSDKNKAKPGDIIVIRSLDGGHHVGFYSGRKNGKFLVLGGNQSNSVNITEFAESQVLGIRRVYDIDDISGEQMRKITANSTAIKPFPEKQAKTKPVEVQKVKPTYAVPSVQKPTDPEEETDIQLIKNRLLDKLVSRIEEMGGDSNIIGNKIGELESLIVGEGIYPYLERIEETSAEVRVYYFDDNKDGEQYISIPKTEDNIFIDDFKPNTMTWGFDPKKFEG